MPPTTQSSWPVHDPLTPSDRCAETESTIVCLTLFLFDQRMADEDRIRTAALVVRFFQLVNLNSGRKAQVTRTTRN